MQLYWHHVGQAGSQRDFPKTVFAQVSIDTIEANYPKTVPLRDETLSELKKLWPKGLFNVWGVPAGSKYVITNMEAGDTVLLVASAHIGGAGVPALCEVKLFPKVKVEALSQALWGEERFPYIFFFDTQRLDYSWISFLDHLGYQDAFNPRGMFYHARADRLNKHGGPLKFVSFLRDRYAA